MTQPRPQTMAELRAQLLPTKEARERAAKMSREIQAQFPCTGTRCGCQVGKRQKGR